MIAALLITFREVIEAALIVATILGILTKLGQNQERKTVWLATAAAALVSILLLGLGSILGIEVQELYEGNEAVIEGILMIASALFITWAVFFLHTYFGKYKTKLLSALQTTVEKNERRGLFALVFTAVVREGFEIVLFLATMYISATPLAIFGGFVVGLVLAMLLSFGLFTATIRLPVFYAFRISSLLLILFAAGLLAGGAHEFIEVGLLPELSTMNLPWVPSSTTLAGDLLHTIFGITNSMNITQLIPYLGYITSMTWWVFIRKSTPKVAAAPEK